MRTTALLALLVLPLAAGGCGGPDPAELERRIGELERRLDEEVELADRVARLRQLHEVATATALLDLVDLQGLVVRLAHGETPGAHDLTSVEGAARGLKHADWPDYLRTEAENAAESLDALAEALRGRDAERARALAPQALAFQLEMRRATARWLEAVAPWQRTTRPPHVHGPDSAHMDHDPRHGGVVGMWGDVHLEARADRDGAIRVWLSGPTREPLSAEGVTGHARLAPDTPQERRLLLSRAGEDLLAASAGALTEDSLHLAVTLQGTPEGEVKMDFALPVLEP